MIGRNLLEIEDIKTDIVVKDYIPLHRGNYNILTGAGGVGKSQIALKIMAHFLQANPKEKAVAVFSEDTKAVIIERLDLITRDMMITTKEIVERSYFTTLDGPEVKTFVSKINKSNLVDIDYVNNFIIGSAMENVGIIVFDPLEAFHTGLSENDAEDMKFLTVEVFQRIAKETGAAVLVLHHTAKGDKGGSRGSSVITNKGRIAYNVRKLMEVDKDMGIEKIKKGWENSVLLSTIKDNHYIARYCNTLKNESGKLTLPVVLDNTSPKITEYEF